MFTTLCLGKYGTSTALPCRISCIRSGLENISRNGNGQRFFSATGQQNCFCQPMRSLADPPCQNWCNRKMYRNALLTLKGHCAMVHAITHIEFNAINLALDAVWRFPHMPLAYYRDWLGVAVEESRHFTLLRNHLREHRSRLRRPCGTRRTMDHV